MQTTANAGNISPAKKKVLLIAVLMMAAGFSFSGYGGSIATPTRLAQIGGSEYYALNNALSTMAMMLALPMVGKLSEIFGCKAIALTGMGFQLIMRFGAMVAPTPVLFIAASTLSNLGAGLYVSLAHTIISGIIPQASRSKYFGYIATCNALGALSGPLAVGQLVDWGQAVIGFIAHAPLVILSGILIFVTYPSTKGVNRIKTKFDFAGVLMLVAGVSAFVLWISLGGKAFAWFSLPSVIVLLVGAVSIVLLIWYENRQANPSVPIFMFRKKRFTTAFLCMALVASYSTTAAGFLIFYAQQIMQVSPQLSSTVTMPQTIVQAICGVLIGRVLAKNFTRRFRPFALVSLVLVVIATFVLYTLTPNSPMLVIYASTILGGIAMSICQTSYTPFMQTELKPSEYASAQGMYSFGSTGGSCIFSALAGALLNMGLTYNSIFLMATGFCLVALVIGLFGFRFSQSEKNSHALPA